LDLSRFLSLTLSLGACKGDSGSSAPAPAPVTEFQIDTQSVAVKRDALPNVGCYILDLGQIRCENTNRGQAILALRDFANTLETYTDKYQNVTFADGTRMTTEDRMTFRTLVKSARREIRRLNSLEGRRRR